MANEVWSFPNETCRPYTKSEMCKTLEVSPTNFGMMCRSIIPSHLSQLARLLELLKVTPAFVPRIDYSVTSRYLAVDEGEE